MEKISENKLFDIAFQFVEHTQRSIFLTGKAGTGKTTFLRYVQQNSSKKLIVTAPTGIAAIHAKGVTLHSFFQLPFHIYNAKSFSQTGKYRDAINKHTLLKNLRITGAKKKIIQELELLIIDEVSMLRADMLDALQDILQFTRKNKQPFGGVQMLFIGDLFQLPPVVLDHEMPFFNEQYVSPFFIHAHCMQLTQCLQITLDKIYRQQDDLFINILNQVRHNDLKSDTLQMLNSRLISELKAPKKAITITTHNHKADKINEKSLNQINTPIITCSGTITGDFPEKQWPTDLHLKLKIGAKVMFIKNDSSATKQYYNGKLGIIKDIENDTIWVSHLDNEDEIIEVNRESWKQITYSYNESTKLIEEQVIGEFKQFPLRLAWAITIHKSQGLTFDEVVIDAGYAFAPGQVYVALSRCRSLEGIYLRTPIHAQAIKVDERIATLSLSFAQTSNLIDLLKADQIFYSYQQLIALFSWQHLLDEAFQVKNEAVKYVGIHQNQNLIAALHNFIQLLEKTAHTALSFQRELTKLCELDLPDDSQILNRAKQGAIYFLQILQQDVHSSVEHIYHALTARNTYKNFRSALQSFEELYIQTIQNLQQATFNQQQLVPEHLIVAEPPRNYFAKKNNAHNKGDSVTETLIYFTAGKTIDEICTLRKLSRSTIEKHLCTGVYQGDIFATEFLLPEQLSTLTTHFSNTKKITVKSAKEKFQQQFSYFQIQVAVQHFLYLNKVNKNIV